MAEKIGLAAVMDLANFNKGINDYNSKLDTASGNTDKKAGLMSKALGAIGGGAKVAALGVAGLAAGAIGAAGGIAAMVMKTAASSDELAEMSDKTGIGVERLQELKYIGEQTGTGVETVTGAIARLTRGMGDAAAGTGPAAGAFDTLGISVTNADGTLRDADVVFGEALTALGNVGNETERDALAMDIFGKSAQELNPLINAGAEGMAAMAQEARDMGAVVGEETVLGMADLNDSMASLKAGFGGIVSELAGAFLPIFQKVLGWMNETLMPFIRETLVPWIQENLPKALQVLSDFWENVLQPAVEAVWNWLSTVLIPFLRDTVKPWLEENIPKALQVLSDFWENILKPAIETVWEFLSTTVIPFLRDTVVPWLQEHVPEAIQTLSDFWEETLKPAIETVWDFLSNTVIPFFRDEVIPMLKDKVGGAVSSLKDFWDKLKGALEDVHNFIRDDIGPKIQWFKDEVIDPIAGAIGTVADAVEDVWSWLGDMYDRIRNFTIPAWIQNLIDKLSQIKIPDVLIGDSPSPFELSLWGIEDALQAVTADAAKFGNAMSRIGSPQISMRSLAPSTMALASAGSYSSSRAVNMTMNPTINNGMDLAMLQNFITKTIQEALLW